MIVADLPFGAYGTPETAYANAVQLMQAGAHMVKLEGGAWLADTVRFLTERAIPVCAHLGLTPQSVHQLGGYQGTGQDHRKRRAAEGRCAGAAGGRRLAAGAGSDSGDTGQGSDRGCCRFPPSASAPARTAPARCW
jgi:hypothetical protein